ncbi:hypothetical protein F4810DRAFT_158952 [Camillea tinctor]|nr:hypothetical protein F4810DRAFT_158952 [Camillea tinctor]
MAEAALGFAGTAAGLISLGIQVYGGLNKYLRDFKSRDERIEKTLRYLDQMKGSLDIIKDAVPKVLSQQQVPNNTVISNLKLCEVELRSLQSRLQQYEIIPRTDIKAKLRNVKTKLQFPFNLSELDDLERQLDRIVRSLMVATNGLMIDKLADVRTTVFDIDANSRTSKTMLSTLDDKVNKLQISDGGTKSRLADIESILRTMVDVHMSDLSNRISTLEDVTSSVHNTTTTLLTTHSQQISSQSQLLTDFLQMLQSHQLQACQSDEKLYARNLTGMIISKPNLLKDMKDTFTVPQSDTQVLPRRETHLDGKNTLDMSSPQWVIPDISCNCRPRRETNHNWSRWPQFWLFNDTTINMRHEPNCLLSNPRIHERQRNVGFVYTGLQRFLSTAVSISLRLNYGAGGYSISPTFRSFTMVDDTKSPAFVLATYLSRVVIRLGIEEKDVKLLLDYGLSKLRRLYQNGIATPTDINQNGWTVVQEATTEIMRGFLDPLEDNYLRRGKYLKLAIQNIGLPYGSTMGNSLIDHFYGLVVQITPFRDFEGVNFCWESFLYEAILNMPGHTDNRQYFMDWFPYFRERLCQSEEFMEYLGFDNPLDQTLVRQNQQGLLRVLLSPEEPYIGDTYIWDQKWPYIALSWPRGLELIINNSPRLDLDTRQNGDSGHTLLSLAIERASDIVYWSINHHIRSDARDCTGTINILLNHNCSLSTMSIDKIGHYNCRFPELADMILQYIKEGRERLRILCQEYLNEEEQIRLGICNSSILDSHVAEIIAVLAAKGISASKCLKLKPDDYRLCPPYSGLECESIFHRIGSSLSADLAFNLGFRDVDVPFKGQTPLDDAAHQYNRGRDTLDGYVMWLIDHGADYTRLASGRNPARHTIAHRLHRILYKFLFHSTDIQDAPRRYKLFANIQIKDDCVCGCCATSQGCSPLHRFLYYLSENRSRSKLSFFEYLCRDTQSPMPFEPFIRILTFDRLKIRHTCCLSMGNDYDYSDDYGDDFEYLRQEDESLLQQLEILVAEFTERFREEGGTLAEFLDGTWTMRMKQVEKEQRSRVLTREEKDSLRAIGVDLTDGLSDNSSNADPVLSEWPVLTYEDRLKDVYSEIDQIVDGRISDVVYGPTR